MILFKQVLAVAALSGVYCLRESFHGSPIVNHRLQARNGQFSATPSTSQSAESDIPTGLVFAPSTTTGEFLFFTALDPAPITNVALTDSAALPTKPTNTAVVPIGFQSNLSWAFVSSNENAQSEILELLPLGVAFGLGVDPSDCAVQELRPFVKAGGQDFIPTVAYMYMPSDSVINFTIAVPNPESLLYRNPNVTIASLMTAIDPNFPVLPGSELELSSNMTSAATGQPTTSSLIASNPTDNSTPSSSTIGILTDHPTTSSSAAVNESSTNVSGGEMAGIVVSIFVLLAISAGILFCLIRRRRSGLKILTKSGISKPTYYEADTSSSRAAEMDGRYTQMPAEKLGNPRSEIPGVTPGPGFVPEVAVGGADQGFIVEMPDTSRREIRLNKEETRLNDSEGRTELINFPREEE